MNWIQTECVAVSFKCSRPSMKFMSRITSKFKSRNSLGMEMVLHQRALRTQSLEWREKRSQDRGSIPVSLEHQVPVHPRKSVSGQVKSQSRLFTLIIRKSLFFCKEYGGE